MSKFCLKFVADLQASHKFLLPSHIDAMDKRMEEGKKRKVFCCHASYTTFLPLLVFFFLRTKKKPKKKRKKNDKENFNNFP